MADEPQTIGDLFADPSAGNPPQAPDPVDRFNPYGDASLVEPPGGNPLGPASPANQGTNWGGIFQAGLAGLAGARGDLGFGQRQALQQQEMELRKRAADRQDLATSFELISKGKESETKYGSMVADMELKKLGFSDDEIKAMSKEDNETFDSMYMAPMQQLMDDNPGLGLSGARTAIRKLTPQQKIQLFEKVHQEKSRQDLHDLEKQLNVPPPANTTPAPIQAPPAPQSGEPQSVTDLVAAKTKAIEQSYQAPISQLEREHDLLKRNIELVANAPGISKEAQKERLTQLEQLVRENRTKRTQVGSELDGKIRRVERQAQLGLTERSQNLLNEDRDTNRSMLNADRDASRGLRQELVNQKIVSGWRWDKSLKQWRNDVTQGELLQNRANFQGATTPEKDTYDLLKTAMPVLDRLEELVPRVLAANPGKQLSTVIKNYAGSKVKTDPDLNQLLQLSQTAAFENARSVTTGSRFAVTLFNQIEGKEAPGIAMTAPVAMQTLKTNRATIQNRMAGIIGEPLQKMPGSESDRVSVISPSGVVGTIPKSQLEAARQNGYKLK